MNKQKNDLFDNEHWTVNHNSPMSKWLFNLSLYGFKYNITFGIIWIAFFNPISVMFYISVIFIILIKLFLV